MRRRKLLPARSLLAIRSSDKGTATWAIQHHVWFCESASKHLRWMKGMESFGVATQQLKERGFTWSWIESNVPGKLKPPF